MARLRRSIAVALCAALLAGAAQADTVLRRGNRFEPATLDPQKYQTHYEANIILDLFEGLLTYDAAAKPVPGVAQRWTTSPDGKTWTFTLKPNLKWSDGAPLTADDVVFTFQRLLTPATAAQYAQLFYVIENGREVNTGAVPSGKLGVAAPNATTVVFKLNTPAPYLPEVLANAFASVLPRHAIDKRGADWVKPGVMVSNGAYALTSWATQDKIEMAKNAGFHDAASAKIDRIVYYPSENITSALARFRAGELDTQIEFPAAQIDAVRANLPQETKLAPSLLTYYLALNTENSKLADVRVRRALSLAIDRDILTSRITKADEKPAYNFVPPAIANYTPPVHPDAALTAVQRLDESKRLLAEAGYGPGKPLKLAYSFSSNEDLKRIAVAIAGMWKRVGVEAELLNREGRVHFASLKSGDFELGYAGWSADFNDAATFMYVLQSASVNSNYSRYRNARFDTLMDRVAQTVDMKARAGLLAEAEVLALRDQPIIPLFNGVTRNLVAQSVKGWVPNAIDYNLTRYLSLDQSAVPKP
ncbi:MAG: peptide ABC transporter substrate-binding protein [Rhodospirillaceae bacterium]|nr:peptide ABC transporter substrate-binding protein [Rhodospirillaceae bacterium]